jgi:PIN domain nuclease of toxin-antitoxin system
MIVLDTLAWLFWLHDPRRLGNKSRRAIQLAAEDGCALVSVISVWEVALKVRLGRLALHLELDQWLSRASSYPGIQIVGLDPDDAIESTRLPGDFHRDPADRLIVALARRHGAKLVTQDERIQAYAHVETLW